MKHVEATSGNVAHSARFFFVALPLKQFILDICEHFDNEKFIVYMH